MCAIDSPDVLLHVGFHKTGTSLLQQTLFARKHYGFFRWPEDRQKTHEVFVRYGPYDLVTEEAVEALRRHVETAGRKGLTFVVSHERLSGYPASGGYDSRVIAERLRGIFPRARVLIVIREQRAMIRSAYSQFVSDGGSMSLRRFLNPPDPHRRRIPYFDLNFYDYAPMIAHYHALFGAERVLVLPYEMLRRDNGNFFDRIGRFARNERWTGVDPNDAAIKTEINTRSPLLMQAMRRVVNGWFTRNQLSNCSLVDIPYVGEGFGKLRPLFEVISLPSLERALMQRMDRQIELHVGDYYKESNSRTSTLIGVNLLDYGYMLVH